MRLVGGVPLLLDIMNGNTKLSSRGHRAGWRGEGGEGLMRLRIVPPDVLHLVQSPKPPRLASLC